MVKRKGLDFTEYGLVDARAAKRQRLSGDSNDPKYVLNSHAVLFIAILVFTAACVPTRLFCVRESVDFHHWSSLQIGCLLCEDLSFVVHHKRQPPSASCCCNYFKTSTLLLDPAC